MVQFGKTEVTNHATKNLYDTSRHSTTFVTDKTSNQFIHVKDIITNNNVYRHMDVTLMAATLALSIATPLINTLIQKAINRWNDDVPLGMQDEADNDMILLKGKVEKMANCLDSPVDLKHIKSNSVVADDFLRLQHDVSEFLKGMTDVATKDIVEGFCKKDKPRITRGETLLMKLHDCFGSSIKSAMQFTPESLMIGNFKYDHAIECIERMIPSSMMCTRNSFLVRKMVTVYHVGLIDSQVEEVEEKLSMFYFVKKQKLSDDNTLVQLIPRGVEVTVHMLSILYGVDLTMLKNAHFFSMKTRQAWFLVNDPNLSVEAILETKLGHSIAVLGEVVEEIATHAAGVMRENNPHDDLQNVFLEADKGPFKCKIKMRQFGNPLSLFNVRTEDDLLPLDKNFKTMTALIRVCGALKVHYPGLIRKSNREIEEYVFRSKVMSESTYQQATAPDLMSEIINTTIRDSRTAAAMSEYAGTITGSVKTIGMYPSVEDVQDGLRTGLDDIFVDTQAEALVPKGIFTIRQIPKDRRKQLRTIFKDVAFKVIRISSGNLTNQYRIRRCNSPEVHEILGEMSLKQSVEYKNQLWYVKGEKLFEDKGQFVDAVINKDKDSEMLDR